jgi:sulfatase modifying factor 1
MPRLISHRLPVWLAFATIVGLALSVTAPTSAQSRGRKVALVVGVQEYDHRDMTDLRFAEGDAARLTETLRRLGFEVTLLTATEGRKLASRIPTAANIRAAAESLAKGLTKRDTALIALSGHGIQPSGGNEAYFCPQDANPTLVYDDRSRAQPQDPTTLIGLDDLLKRVHGRGVGGTLLLVDACRNEPLRKGRKGIKGIESVVFDTPDQSGLLLSCSKGEFSFEIEGLGGAGEAGRPVGAGVFFHYVIEGLNGKAADPEDGIVTWDGLTNYVKRRVPAEVKKADVGSQTPASIGHLEGVIELARPVETTARPLVWPFGEAAAKAGQMAWAKSLGKAVVEKNGIGMELVVIPPGTYTMGSPASEKDRHESDESQVSVTLTRAFQMSRTEVTQGQWKAVMGTEPWKGMDFVKEGDDYPATYVSWADAVAFCEKLSSREGVTYRLPREAEWEWACRAGTKTAWSFGDSAGELGRYGWFEGNADKVKEEYAHRVGQKLANGFGLSDMHGNVWEWCGDWYGDKLAGESNPVGASSGSVRVFRGGSWSLTPADCRSALRNGSVPSARSNYLGFRLVLSPSGS